MSEGTNTFNESIHYVIGLLAGPGVGVYDLIGQFLVLLGLILIFVGLIRLSRHGRQQQMFRYHSPAATTFYFVSGAALLSYVNYFQMMSFTFFGTSSTMYDMTVNPIYAYVNTNPDSWSTNDALIYLLYSCLAVIGLIATARGTFGLIRTGEGNGGGMDTVSCIVHIIAGTIALNAESFLNGLGIWTNT